MNDLTDEQADRLESAHAFFARGDGVARARLLAALEADVPPALSPPRKSRYERMKPYISRAAVAAALLLTSVVGWSMYQPQTLFAQVVQAMSRAKGFSCDLIQVAPVAAGAENLKFSGHAFWSSSSEERLELPEATIIFRPGKTGLRLELASRQYRILPASSAREFTLGLFARLGDFKGKAEPIAIPREIGGVKAEGFTVPWPSVVGDDTHPDAKLQVWLDPATKLPVRVDLLGFGPQGSLTFRFENFRWGSQDHKLFDASIPAGYTKLPTLDAKVDQITGYVVYGLSVFAKYNNGKYPAVKYIYGDQQGEALRKLMGMGAKAQGWMPPSKDLKWPNPKDGEFAHGSYGFTWINTIQRDFPEGVYNGKTVTPQDATKVLLRWQLDDGDYRVIFGDLKSATVSSSQLRKLEAP